MLILCYLIVAASFFVHEDPTSGGNFLIKTCIHMFAISPCVSAFFERSDLNYIVESGHNWEQILIWQMITK